ncbi:MAG: oxidoreductase [Bacteroidetes bacterium]|nr:MAG: oxidoreductase [Bacteroidota bacterium]PTM15090.1 MAG: oxidoreductase [Bacteroidota bacterium]
MKYFGITGVAGYIAPRHLESIQATGNSVIAALDPNDSVGILDRYSHDIAFFTEFERFDRHLERIKRDPARTAIDYLTICSPNYLHDAHMRLALRLGVHAICEKPLVTNPWQLDALQQLELESEGRVYGILQLRVHPLIIAFREKIMAQPKRDKQEVNLTYITSRGRWYNYSWKGDESKSGGISANIGIHFFDMLIWIFGPVIQNKVYLKEPNKMSGFLELENAYVNWYLAIDKNDLPHQAVAAGKPTYRSITVDGEEMEFSEGFTDLHTRMYEVILEGNGYGLNDVRPSIELVNQIRSAPVSRPAQVAHPALTKAH